jgi:hypothetical protein
VVEELRHSRGSGAGNGQSAADYANGGAVIRG